MAAMTFRNDRQIAIFQLILLTSSMTPKVYFTRRLRYIPVVHGGILKKNCPVQFF